MRHTIRTGVHKIAISRDCCPAGRGTEKVGRAVPKPGTARNPRLELELGIQKRQRAGALQNLADGLARSTARQVLECASPLALFAP